MQGAIFVFSSGTILNLKSEQFSWSVEIRKGEDEISNLARLPSRQPCRWRLGGEVPQDENHLVPAVCQFSDLTFITTCLDIQDYHLECFYDFGLRSIRFGWAVFSGLEVQIALDVELGPFRRPNFVEDGLCGWEDYELKVRYLKLAEE